MLPFPLRICTWRRYPPCFALLFPDGPFFLLVCLYPSLSTCTLLDNTALTVSVEIVCWPVFTPFQLLVIKYSKSWVTAFDIVYFFLTSEFVGMTHPSSWLTSPLQWHLLQLCLSHGHQSSAYYSLAIINSWNPGVIILRATNYGQFYLSFQIASFAACSPAILNSWAFQLPSAPSA